MYGRPTTANSIFSTGYRSLVAESDIEHVENLENLVEKLNKWNLGLIH